MIIVTGATGKLGRAIVDRLLETSPADSLGVSVRDPEKARDLAERGVRVRQGDYEDPEGLRHTFDGAERVLIVSSGTIGEAALRHHRNAIDAAKDAGVVRVVYTGHMGASPDSTFPPMRTHAATRTMLEESGLAFTFLSNGFYADSALLLMGDFARTGQVVAPEDGPISWTAHSDLASAAAIALTQEKALDGVTPPLTGVEALDLAALVELASEATGRTLRRVVVDDATFREGLVARGLPQERIEMIVGLYAASRRGEFARVDPVLEGLLGRPPVSMRSLLERHSAE